MHTFQNKKIQALYNYLAEDFEWNDLEYSEESTIEKFKLFIDNFTENDWTTFELTIAEWDSSVLFRLGKLINYNNYHARYPWEKIYALAFINCSHEDANDLLDDILTGFSLMPDLDENLLRKVIERVHQFLEGYTFLKASEPTKRTEKTITFLKEKLEITLADKNQSYAGD